MDILELIRQAVDDKTLDDYSLRLCVHGILLKNHRVLPRLEADREHPSGHIWLTAGLDDGAKILICPETDEIVTHDDQTLAGVEGYGHVYFKHGGHFFSGSEIMGAAGDLIPRPVCRCRGEDCVC